MFEDGQYQRSRGGRAKTHTWVDDKPERNRGNDFYLNAYLRLSTCRQPFQYQIGPIPWIHIDDYGRRYRLSRLLHEFFVDLILVTDQKFIEALNKEAEDEAEKTKKEDEKADRKSKRESKSNGFLTEGKQKTPKRKW